MTEPVVSRRDPEHPGEAVAHPLQADAPLRAWPTFSARVLARLEAGAKEYPTSPNRSAAALLDEIQQELEDVCGWSTVLWSKLEALKARLAPPVVEPIVRCPSEPGQEREVRSAEDFRTSGTAPEGQAA